MHGVSFDAPKIHSRMRTPDVHLNPRTALLTGFDEMGRLLALTLGPARGHVLSLHEVTGKVELHEDAAMIARRVVQLPGENANARARDAGAMLMRHSVWRLTQQVGDGGATAAVIARALAQSGTRALTAGADFNALKRGIDAACADAVALLHAQARPLRGIEALIGFAAAVTHMHGGMPAEGAALTLPQVLGELFHNLGPEAHINIEEYAAPLLAREYLEGGLWEGRITSSGFYTNAAAREAVIENGMLVLIEAELKTIDDIAPILELVAEMPIPEARKLVLCAHDISGDALQMLLVNHQAGTLRACGVALRRAGAQREADFDDLAALSGARVIRPELGESSAHITQAHVGMLRRVVATPERVVVTGSAQFEDGVTARLDALQARLRRVRDDADARAELNLRIARLVGRIATLKIGAHTDSERNMLKARAERAVRAVPLAQQHGVLPGGGAALAHCAATLSRAGSHDEAWGRRLLASALEMPFIQLAENCGERDPRGLLSLARKRGAAFGFDAETRSILNLRKAGVQDSAGVLTAALQTAVSGALMLLSISALILRADPQLSLEP